MLVGLGGLVIGGSLGWTWSTPLWGRTDVVSVLLQLGIVAAVATGAPALRRSSADRQRALFPTLLGLVAVGTGAAAVAVTVAVDTGGRGVGGVVTAASAALVVSGVVASRWAYQRSFRACAGGLSGIELRMRGRRLRVAGCGAGGAAAVAVLAAAAAAPVGSEDTSTAPWIEFTGSAPPVAGAPAWQTSLVGRHPAIPQQLRSTPGGLSVDEEHGIRMLDPRTGQARWHWRDEAYSLVSSMLATDGRTVALGLRFRGEREGMDRVVALSVLTGELQWERVDAQLVDGMSLVAAGGPDYFVIANQPDEPFARRFGGWDPDSLGVVVLDAADGRQRWQVIEDPGCRMERVDTGSAGLLFAMQSCDVPDEPDNPACTVTAYEAATGQVRWSWPGPGDLPAGVSHVTRCRMHAASNEILVTYQEIRPELNWGPGPLLALELDSGRPRWAAAPDDDGGPAFSDHHWLITDDAVVDPLQGHLVIRDRGTGEVTGRVALPEGRLYGPVAADEATVVFATYHEDREELSLHAIDVAAMAMIGSTHIATRPEDTAYERISVAAGPQAAAVGLWSRPRAAEWFGSGTLTISGFAAPTGGAAAPATGK